MVTAPNAVFVEAPTGDDPTGGASASLLVLGMAWKEGVICPRRMKWWVVLVTLSCALCSCRRGGAPELIGTWTTETTSPNSVHGTSATYDFKSNGTFEMSGYPPIEVKGRWQVVERSPGKLRLKLTDWTC